MGFAGRDLAPQFLRIGYAVDDWVAVFLKNYQSRQATQRVVPVSVAGISRFQAWLRHKNAAGWNVYISTNAVRPGRSRLRSAVATVRHVFLDEDRDGPALLKALAGRADLPPVSYVLHSSPKRVQVLWRVQGFTVGAVEGLQKHLARELGTDAAATSSSQTMRWAGFANHKYGRPFFVTVDYHRADFVLTPSDFPRPVGVTRQPTLARPSGPAALRIRPHLLERARRYVAGVPSAVSGQHGDLRTFQVCCQLVRGFGLSLNDALHVLDEWNARCQPPWSESELLQKLLNAERYGREPVNGRLMGRANQFS